MDCQFCLKKISGDTQIHLKHLKSHHSFEMSYKCIFVNCYRKFLKFFALEKHMKVCSFRIYQPKSVLNDDIQNNLSHSITKIHFAESTEDSSFNNQNSSSFDDQNKEDVLEVDDIRNLNLKFIAKLYNKSNVPRCVVQEIIEELQETIQNISEHFHSKLKKQLPSEFYDVLENCFDISILKDVRTEYRRFEYLKNSKFFIPPEPFVIGDLYDDKKDGQKTNLIIKKCEGQIISMRKILEAQLEIPGFYEKVINFIDTDISSSYIDQIYSSFRDGIIWKSIKKYYADRVVIPLFLYYDDFETGNPLGTTAGIHKVGALYDSIAALPPQYAASLENIFLIQFIYSSDKTRFGNGKCFDKVIKEIQFLSDTGIVICDTKGCETRIYFIVIALLGDNLGLNGLLGFNESFVSEYFCRICRAPKSVTCSAMFEDENLLRTPENYTQDVINFSHGIKEDCIFNEIPHFNCTINYTCDIMHDLFEGVCRYDLARIIQHCISKNYVTLEHLNHRIKYFNHQPDFDRGNKIPFIKKEHVNNGHLVMSAAEMSALACYLSVIIGDLVPDYDEVWDFYLTLCKIIRISTESIISNDQINYLRYLISSHHEMFKRLFKEKLKPKFHFMVHYPGIIRKMGPLRNLSSIRYEEFHKLSKTYASVITSRKNIILSLATKLQLHSCYRLFSKKGLDDSLERGKQIEIVSIKLTNISLVVGTERLIEFSWIRYNNTLFKPDFLIIIDPDENNLLFGIMTRILLDENNDIFVYYKKCVTLGYDMHFMAYEISLQQSNSKQNLIKISKSLEIRTCNYHVSGDGKYFVSVMNI